MNDLSCTLKYLWMYQNRSFLPEAVLQILQKVETMISDIHHAGVCWGGRAAL